MYYVSRIAGVFALAALGVAVWFSIVLARADAYFRGATPESVERAVQIAARNTEYLAQRALQMEYAGTDSGAVTEKIVELNPMASAPRIRLGLSAELSGDAATAERWLLAAAAVDHQFEPAWTLANFYFRADRRDEFWKWIRMALEVSYGDRTPAFELCWRVSSDAIEIGRRAIPDRHEVVAGYLVYLSQTKRIAALPEVARLLAGYHDGADLPLLYWACDQLLDAGDARALEVWELAGQKVPVGVFNGDFATAPLNHGFDWRLVESPGVTHVPLEGAHRIVLSGREAESVTLLRQTLHIEAGKRYRLRWEARTSGIKSPSGLEWRVGGPLHDCRGSVSAGVDWVGGELTCPAAESFPRLELMYQRPPGEARAEGNVELRHVGLTEVAP